MKLVAISIMTKRVYPSFTVYEYKTLGPVVEGKPGTTYTIPPDMWERYERKYLNS